MKDPETQTPLRAHEIGHSAAKTLRLKLISCEVFGREMEATILRSQNHVEVEYLSKGLHEIGCLRMRDSLQEVIDRVDGTKFQAVLLGYGLCSNGLVGLRARIVPLVIPRAHDCITLFLGSKERYLEYFHQNPGVYFKTSGWIEHSENPDELDQLSLARQNSLCATYEELVAKYGEDNAQFLVKELASQHYGQFTYIEMGVEPDDRFERHTREAAAQRGWKFEKVRGDLSLIQRLVNGDWSDDQFLTVPPGWQVVAKYDERIISAVEAQP